MREVNKQEIARLWAEAYSLPQGDPHTVFAQSIGVSRQEAKTECFKYLFKAENVWVVNSLQASWAETRYIYNVFKGMLEGINVPVPSLDDMLKEMP